MNQFIQEETNYLFGCDFFSDDFDPEGKEEHLERAEHLKASFAWKDVFAAWRGYLFGKCRTPEGVINYCNLFYYYGGHDQFIPDPYDFLGYIYYIVDLDKYWDEAGDFLEGLCISILEKSGDVSLVKDPFYQSWKDPKLLAAVDRHKQARA